MEGFLKEKLDERKAKGLLRTLSNKRNLVDFLSNDYLGLARSEGLGEQIDHNARKLGFLGNGGTGSRLLSGNHAAYASAEKFLAGLFNAEAALIFNSGYAANQAIVSSVAGKGDTILYDRLSHVCLKEGAWLSKAQSHPFEHNDLEDLASKLSRSQGRVFVVTESVFSMDGDESPIEEIIALCKKHKALLIVDEAHSTGTFGENGAGWLISKSVEQDVFARVYTFGKGMGVHGACVAGSQTLIDYLINFGRSFIYTTSLPPHSVISIEEAFKFLSKNMALQRELNDRINLFRSSIDAISHTAIQPILIPGSLEVRRLAEELRNAGFNVRPIVSPTVKEGTERLRVCLHAFNTHQEINELTTRIKDLI